MHPSYLLIIIPMPLTAVSNCVSDLIAKTFKSPVSFAWLSSEIAPSVSFLVCKTEERREEEGVGGGRCRNVRIYLHAGKLFKSDNLLLFHERLAWRLGLSQGQTAFFCKVKP